LLLFLIPIISFEKTSSSFLFVQTFSFPKRKSLEEKFGLNQLMIILPYLSSTWQEKFFPNLSHIFVVYTHKGFVETEFLAKTRFLFQSNR
jgi:hypothetical protein